MTLGVIVLFFITWAAIGYRRWQKLTEEYPAFIYHPDYPRDKTRNMCMVYGPLSWKKIQIFTYWRWHD